MASPLPPESPQSSSGSIDTRQPALDDLVSIFIASKRSLSTINQVWRARDLVESGREALERNAILAASNSFVRCAVDVQLDSLAGIRYGGRVMEIEGSAELKVRHMLFIQFWFSNIPVGHRQSPRSSLRATQQHHGRTESHPGCPCLSPS